MQVIPIHLIKKSCHAGEELSNDCKGSDDIHAIAYGNHEEVPYTSTLLSQSDQLRNKDAHQDKRSWHEHYQVEATMPVSLLSLTLLQPGARAGAGARKELARTGVRPRQDLQVLDSRSRSHWG